MNEPELGVAFQAVFIMLALILILLSLAVSVLIFCKIFHKAGFHWALGLLTLVPIANFIIPFFLAFAKWPIEKELQQLKQTTGQG